MMSIWAKLYPRGGREHNVYLGKVVPEGREGA